jgi:N-acetylglucosaminyl-diphospho-decaprenol L-rhamnosyltransferase
VIEACLDSLRRQAPGVRIVVVDNASSDDTVARVRGYSEARSDSGVQCIANSSNRGFAAAVNQGARAAATSDAVLLLNPDVELSTPLQPLIAACQLYGLAAGQLTDAAGRPQAGFTIRRLPTPSTLVFELLGINRLWKSNPVNRRYRYLDRDLQQPGPVEQPAGAFLMVRRDVWDTLGGMDETFYPVWFEDVDFSRRALDRGFRTEYTPSVTARHKGAHSVGRLPLGCRMTYWCDSLLKYAFKHFQANQFKGVCGALAISSIVRGTVEIFRNRGQDSLSVSMRIARVAARCLLSGQIRQSAGGGD